MISWKICDTITELENDIEFRLRTPRPKTGPLLLTARFVERLIDEHVATVVALDRDAKSLSWEPLSLQTPTMKIALPAIPSATSAAPDVKLRAK